LVVTVDAPYFNDPKPLGKEFLLNFEGLWKFEVVEVFIKGRSDKYVEFEMGPHGHYLILACDGYRQCFNRGIEPISYSASIAGTRWTGRLVCPVHLVPPPTDISTMPYTYNAYAIHNRGVERVYCTAFVPNRSEENEYLEPDFHKLEVYQPLSSIPANLCVSDSCQAASRSIWDNRSYIGIDMGAPVRE